MNDVKKSLLHRFLLGFGAGILIGAVFILSVNAADHSMDELNTWEVAKHLIFCGLYGSASLCGMILYKLDSVSLVIATATHFLIVMAGLFLLGLSIGWEFDTALIRYIFAAYILIFILSWILMYLVGKNRVRKMNRDLQKWKSFRTNLKA